LLFEATYFLITPVRQAAEVITARRKKNNFNFNFNIWHMEEKMRLSPPKNVTWFIALALAVFALLGYTGTVSQFGEYSFWLALISAALMLLATMVKGL
jgi:NhaP-type Na+/H+ or K+/H+ antiporter